MPLKNKQSVVYQIFNKNNRQNTTDNGLINNLVDLMPFFRFDHKMQQSGTAAIQYVVVYCS